MSLADRARRYIELVSALPRPDGDAAAELAQIVATDAFVRIDRSKRQSDWRETLAAAQTGGLEAPTRIGRVDEAGAFVFLEAEEQSAAEPPAHPLRTMHVFEFDGAGRLCRLDVFQ